MRLQELVAYCDDLLQAVDFSDYCPNGLQVEAGDQARRIVSCVTASQAAIDMAVELHADLLLVHHGYFWKGEPAPLIGMKGRRIATLLKNSISLLAYHLPLDAHQELGNNARLARVLGFHEPCAQPDGLLWQGRLSAATTLDGLADHVSARLGREVLRISAGGRLIERVAWCTGGAQSYMERAAALGVDAFVSGEVSEQTYHQARELGVHYLAAGHHATERYGVQALGEHLAERFGLSHQYVEIDNPV